MAVTESQALAVVSLALMKTELRIEQSETSHDALLVSQIVNAVSYAKESTGREVADFPALRAAAVAIVRAQYNGLAEITPDAAHNAWLDPFRSIAG